MGRVTVVGDAPEAEALLAAGSPPDLLVFAQAFPGEFSRAQVERLRRRAPLARIVGLLGTWCEGEMRSGEPWPGVIRVYWHQWAARAQRELVHMLRGEASAWTAPLTATEEERLLADHVERRAAWHGLVAIHTRWGPMENWLAAACRARGCSTVWLRPPHAARVEGAAAGLFDGSELGPAEADELRHFVAALAPAPVVALLDFPRIDDHQRALDCGAAVVLSKPLHIEDFLWTFSNLPTSRS